MHIEKLVPGGQGLTTLNDKENPAHGKKLFLWNVLPGEIIEDFELTKKKSSYLEGIATKISSPSPRRTAPKDACFLSTSPWQVLDYSYELEQKRLLVAESLRQEGITPDLLEQHHLEISPVKTDGIEWHYRNKMEYALYWDNSDEKIYLAFHARGSHKKIPLRPFLGGDGTSSLERPEIAEKALKIVQELNSKHAEARTFQSLLLRTNQQGIVSGGLLENFKPHPSFPPLTDFILGRLYSYSPNGFFQINLPVYELALKEIKAALSTEKVLDLYSGVGSIGLSIASDRNLTLVESNKAAFVELNRNCQLTTSLASGEVDTVSEELKYLFQATKENSRISREGHGRLRVSVEPEGRLADRARVRLNDEKNPTEFSLARNKYSSSPKAYLAKSEDCLDFIEPDQPVSLDPPRAGCDKKLINRLLEIRPKTVIYLSCNPSTQARDVRALTETGIFKIQKISPFNFFPKTPHIENLIILESAR
ncbi:class I SAM-dependent RNA methyltransferase [Candidatus Saccharibacteria bacterium]|nr:class I SAM-dependent RNA methyltransferase [Candidatus Saccharibacteria bacterium]